MKVSFNEFLVFGDLAGRYNEMCSILSQAPKDIPIICVGDPNDRGPDSKKVIEFFMHPDRYLTQSNHATFIVDNYEDSKIYEDGLWLAQGGLQTMKSYGVHFDEDLRSLQHYFLICVDGYGKEDQKFKDLVKYYREEFAKVIPQSHIDFLKSSPMYIETDEVIITHAPINPIKKLEESIQWGRSKLQNWDRADMNFIWRRDGTRRRDKIQIHGHCALVS